MPNMKNFPLLSGAHTIQRHWCMRGKLISVFGLADTGSQLCAATCAHMPSSQTYIPALKGMRTWKHLVYSRVKAFMCELNVHKQVLPTDLRTLSCYSLFYHSSSSCQTFTVTFMVETKKRKKKKNDSATHTGTFKVSPPPQSSASSLASLTESKHKRQMKLCQLVCVLHMNGALMN